MKKSDSILLLLAITAVVLTLTGCYTTDSYGMGYGPDYTMAFATDDEPGSGIVDAGKSLLTVDTRHRVYSDGESGPLYLDFTSFTMKTSRTETTASVHLVADWITGRAYREYVAGQSLILDIAPGFYMYDAVDSFSDSENYQYRNRSNTAFGPGIAADLKLVLGGPFAIGISGFVGLKVYEFVTTTYEVLRTDEEDGYNWYDYHNDFDSYFLSGMRGGFKLTVTYIPQD